MKTMELTSKELMTVAGGITTNCPICGKRVSVSGLNALFFGRAAAISRAQNTASAQHYSYASGFNRNVTHY